MRRTNTIFFLLVLLLPLQFLHTQSIDYSRRFDEGVRLFKAVQYKDAERTFKKLHDDFPDSLRTLHYLGRIKFDQQEWADAKDWYKEIVDAAQDDLEAHYYLAICYRELGKFQAFGLRNLTWRKAQRHFRIVYQKDFRFKDVYYQYALLKRFQKDYPEAIHYLRAHIRMHQNADAIVALYRTYESFLFNDKEGLMAWTPDEPDSMLDLFKADGYRHAGELDKAEHMYKTLQSHLPAELSLIPLYISMAKLKYQMDQFDSCQIYYAQAIATIKTDADAALMFQDIKYVFSDEELQEYQKLTIVDDKREFFQKRWISRNPMPASPQNYRIIEHVRRTVLADKEFYFDGVRSQVNNPDKLNYLSYPAVFNLNEKYNDKGLVYIRHGEPDDKAFMVTAGVPLNETWMYYPRGQMNTKLIFHFWQDDDMGADNWRLVPSIPPYMAESRLHMDPIFGRMYTATELEAISLEHEMKLKSQEIVKIGMDTDQHSWNRELRSIFFPFYIATFKGERGRTDCELYYSLSTKDVLHRKAPHTADDSIDIHFAVYDQNLNLLKRQAEQILIQDIVDATRRIGYWPAKLEFSDLPGSYQFALDIRTPDDEAIGGYKFRFNAASYTTSGIQMSGLVLAESISEGEASDPFFRNGFTIVPNPGKAFNRKNPIHIYFEIYNLANDKNMNFIIDYNVTLLEERTSGLLNQISRIFQRSQPSITNEVERVASGPTSNEYIALDLGKNVPGVYQLEVSAFVPGRQETQSRQINFELE